MTSTYIWLPGQPIGKGRPRFTRTGRVYTPEKTRRYEHRLAGTASNYMMLHQLDCTEKPCKVLIKAQFEIPKSWTKAKKGGGSRQTRSTRRNLTAIISQKLCSTLSVLSFGTMTHRFTICGSLRLTPMSRA